MTTANPTQEFSGWKDKASFLSPSHIESVVGGETHLFYPISVEMAFRLRNMGSGMAAAFGALFVDTSNDYGTTNRTVSDDNTKAVQSEMIIDPIEPKIAEIRAAQKERAFQAMFESIVNDKNKEVLAEVIMDSMRGLFPDKANRPPVKEFLDVVPLPCFTEMLIGVFKANKGVLGPLGQTIGDLVNQITQSATEKVMQQVGGEAGEAKVKFKAQEEVLKEALSVTG
jgi:hypothetical protein